MPRCIRWVLPCSCAGDMDFSVCHNHWQVRIMYKGLGSTKRELNLAKNSRRSSYSRHLSSILKMNET